MHSYSFHTQSSRFQTSSRDSVVKETTSIVSVCCRLYYKLFKKEYGHPYDMVNDLSRKVSKYNEEFGEECIKVVFHDEKRVVAICTQLMKRVHQLWRYSSEMAFITTTTKLYVVYHISFQLFLGMSIHESTNRHRPPCFRIN